MSIETPKFKKPTQGGVVNLLEEELEIEIKQSVQKTLTGGNATNNIKTNGKSAKTDQTVSENPFKTTEKKKEINTPNNAAQNNKKPNKSNLKTNRGKRKSNDDSDFDVSDYSDNGQQDENYSTPVKNSNEIIPDAFSNPYNGLPEFLKANNIRDKMGRNPEDSNYDPTSLLVPNTFLKTCTPAMVQYWQFKSDNFDKIMLFKLGKFYEMFYDDAIVGNAVLDLNWMGNDPKKLHVGFPEKCLEEKAAKLIQAGFKVCVVEQTERPDDMKERTKGSAIKEKVVKRELCNVFTKGTYMNDTNSSVQKNFSYSNKYCLALVCNLGKEKYSNFNSQNNSQGKISGNLEINEVGTSQQVITQGSNTVYSWGFVIFDVTTLKFYIGSFVEEDESFSKIMTLLYNLKPEEVILMRNNLPNYILNFISSLSTKPQLTYLKNDYNVLLLNKICTKYFGSDIDKWQKSILNYVSEEDVFRNACCALYITAIYLEKILLAEQCLPIAIFEEYVYNNHSNFTQFGSKTMVLDFQAVSNLELVETKFDAKNVEAGSLLEFINRAVSPFGRRLIKTWLLNPLADISEINERLDMVEDFINNPDLLSSFRTSLSKWPDVERQCSKIYKFAISSNIKVVYFEDVSKIRMMDFFNLITFLKKSVEIFRIFEKFNLKSQKLRRKVTFFDTSNKGNENVESLVKFSYSQNSEEGLVPNIKQELELLSQNFTVRYEKDEKDSQLIIVEPISGICSEYDELKEEIQDIEQKFDDILKREKSRLKCAVLTYAHTKFYKYELEVPEEYVIGDKRPSDYKMTTSKKGYLRFHTDEILKLVEKLDTLQESLKEEMKKFNHLLFKQFYSKSAMINEYIKNIAELDCLASLASVSSDSGMVRPQFITLDQNEGTAYLELIQSKHPCLSNLSHGFVANDIVIGHKDYKGSHKTAIVITGPNMGGKSTLLRQTCVSVIMAQMGMYVSAEKCILTPVDRIFTRIGAKDK